MVPSAMPTADRMNRMTATMSRIDPAEAFKRPSFSAGGWTQSLVRGGRFGPPIKPVIDDDRIGILVVGVVLVVKIVVVVRGEGLVSIHHLVPRAAVSPLEERPWDLSAHAADGRAQGVYGRSRYRPQRAETPPEKGVGR